MIQKLDNLLNRFSMYRLVSISLGVMLGYAALLALLGQLTYSPMAMLASATVLVLAVYGTTLLMGRIFGSATHDESTFITGLILFFIMTPTAEPRGLMTLAIVGIFAATSKFLLTVRGRHIFNPAAIAVAIAGLMGVAYASWWVATPVLLPVTLVTALLIIYKTRRHALAGVFLAVATLLILINMVSYGTPLLEAMSLLGSWPLLFFAGYMLTEPLTLPTKHWQQVVEAALVAVLFAVPIHIGDFTLTQASALIIGNLFALAVTRRRKIELVFKERRSLTPSSDEFVFTTKRPLLFEAGQYAELTLVHPRKDSRGVRRSFSFTSRPGEEEVTFGVKFYEPASTFKRALRHMEPGMIVTSTGVSGDFTLPKDQTVPLLLVAGGIGITPFISHLRHVRQVGEERDIAIIYSIAHPEELAYVSVLRESGFPVIIICKDPKPRRYEWVAGWYETLDAAMVSRAITDLSDRHAYVSGPPAMVRYARLQLRQAGVARIQTDYFTGY